MSSANSARISRCLPRLTPLRSIALVQPPVPVDVFPGEKCMPSRFDGKSRERVNGRTESSRRGRRHCVLTGKSELKNSRFAALLALVQHAANHPDHGPVRPRVRGTAHARESRFGAHSARRPRSLGSQQFLLDSSLGSSSLQENAVYRFHLCGNMNFVGLFC